jgi:hypothetical protein
MEIDLPDFGTKKTQSENNSVQNGMEENQSVLELKLPPSFSQRICGETFVGTRCQIL